MIWRTIFPLGTLRSTNKGPYLSFYLDSTSDYIGRNNAYNIVYLDSGNTAEISLPFDWVVFMKSGCADSQNIYNQWTGPWSPCPSAAMARLSGSGDNPQAGPFGGPNDEVDYPYPAHIQVNVIGAQVTSVYDQTTSSPATLVPNGEIKTGQAVKSVSGNGLYTVLYLPAADTYQIQAEKFAGFKGLKVFVTIPNADGTAQKLNYDNLSTGEADATAITFTVGRNNPNTAISRTLANDIYNPDYNAALATVLNPLTNLNAAINNSGTQVTLSWTKTASPSLASVLVIRKVGSAPSSSADGVTVYSGTGQSVTDTVTPNTIYYYAAYGMDIGGNPSTPTITRVDTNLRSIFGSIYLTSGGGLGNASIELVDNAGRIMVSATSAPDGTYAITNVANGSFTLTASHPTADMAIPSVSVTLNGSSQQVDFNAPRDRPTLILLFDALSVNTGNPVSILWTYRNIGNSETVNIGLLRNGVWDVIASGVPILDGMVPWTVTAPVVQSATMRISLASNPLIYAEYTFRVLGQRRIMVISRGPANLTDPMEKRHDGTDTIWYMEGTTWNGGYADVLPEVIDTEWNIVGIADFNNDSKPDLLWRNTNTVRTTIWYMAGATWNGGMLMWSRRYQTRIGPSWA